VQRGWGGWVVTQWINDQGLRIIGEDGRRVVCDDCPCEVGEYLVFAPQAAISGSGSVYILKPTSTGASVLATLNGDFLDVWGNYVFFFDSGTLKRWNAATESVDRSVAVPAGQAYHDDWPTLTFAIDERMAWTADSEGLWFVTDKPQNTYLVLGRFDHDCVFDDAAILMAANGSPHGTGANDGPGDPSSHRRSAYRLGGDMIICRSRISGLGTVVIRTGLTPTQARTTDVSSSLEGTTGYADQWIGADGLDIFYFPAIRTITNSTRGRSNTICAPGRWQGGLDRVVGAGVRYRSVENVVALYSRTTSQASPIWEVASTSIFGTDRTLGPLISQGEVPGTSYWVFAREAASGEGHSLAQFTVDETSGVVTATVDWVQDFAPGSLASPGPNSVGYSLTEHLGMGFVKA